MSKRYPLVSVRLMHLLGDSWLLVGRMNGDVYRNEVHVGGTVASFARAARAAIGMVADGGCELVLRGDGWSVSRKRGEERWR
jgi:hypothetical protein